MNVNLKITGYETNVSVTTIPGNGNTKYYTHS